MKKLLLVILLAAQAAAAAAVETGCVYDLGGPALIKKSGASAWQPARKGAPVSEGDSLQTGKGAWCEVLFRDGTFIKLAENSETSADTLKSSAGERTFSFSFLKGKALWMAAKMKNAAASRFSVRTPSAVCAVRGTDFSMLVSTAGETTVGLFEGKVALSSGTVEKELLPGGEASASAGEIAVQARLSRLMQIEQKRYDRVKGRVESLRKRLAERDSFIDDYIARQRKTLEDFEARRKAKLKKQ